MSYSVNRGRRREFDVSVSANTYAGELALPFATPALKANETIANGYVRVLDGVHYKAVIPIETITDTLQAATCDYSDGQDLTLNEEVVTLTELAVGETICRKTVYPTWHGAATARETTDVMSQEFKNFTLGLVAAKTAEHLETVMWTSQASLYTQGFLSNDGVFDESGADASKLGGCREATISSVTASNAIEQIGLVYANAADNIPAVLGKSDVGIYVNNKTAALYMQNLATAGVGLANNVGVGVNGQSTNQAFAGLQYLGVPVRVCPGMPDDAILLANTENLVVANNLGTDLNSVRWIPAYEYDGSDNIKIVMRMAVGQGCPVPTDCVLGATFWT